MKLLRPAPETPGAQLELPLAEALPPVTPEQQDLSPTSAPQTPETASPWPPALPNGRRLQVGERTVHYALKRSSRRTIGFTVDDRGLSITAPAG